MPWPPAGCWVALPSTIPNVRVWAYADGQGAGIRIHGASLPLPTRRWAALPRIVDTTRLEIVSLRGSVNVTLTLDG